MDNQSSMRVLIQRMSMDVNLVGGIPTPLKNDGARQLEL